MAIPNLNRFGFLPPGIHIATYSQVLETHGCRDDGRSTLWVGFDRFFKWIAETEAFASVELFGSFFTLKENPSDIDVALEFRRSDESGRVPREIFHQESIKATYGVDLVIKRPEMEAYYRIAPEGYPFVTPYLAIAREVSRDELIEIRNRPRIAPGEVPFKGTIKIEL